MDEESKIDETAWISEEIRPSWCTQAPPKQSKLQIREEEVEIYTRWRKTKRWSGG